MPLPSMWPRVSVTSNQRMLRTVADARATALRTASSMPVVDDPADSAGDPTGECECAEAEPEPPEDDPVYVWTE